MDPELYATLNLQTKSITELTKDDYIFDYSLASLQDGIETDINEAKAVVWVDRLSIRKQSNKVCLSDKLVAQILYEVWFSLSVKDIDLQIEYANLIVMVGKELSGIINDLELVIRQDALSVEGEEDQEGEEKTGKDEEGVTSQYKSNKSGEEDEGEKDDKPKEKKKQNMDYLCH